MFFSRLNDDVGEKNYSRHPWRENRNALFVIGIFCVFLMALAVIQAVSCLLLLIFRRNYIIRYFFRFLRFMEGHGVYLFVYVLDFFSCHLSN